MKHHRRQHEQGRRCRGFRKGYYRCSHSDAPGDDYSTSDSEPYHLWIRTVLAKLGVTPDTLNRDCGDEKDIHACDTLADLAKLMNTLRGVAGQIETAANHGDKNLTTLDSQEGTLFADTHQAFDDFHAKLTDPRVDQFMGYLTSTAGHIDGISADSQLRIHQLLHPDKVKPTFWSGAEGTFLWIKTHATVATDPLRDVLGRTPGSTEICRRAWWLWRPRFQPKSQLWSCEVLNSLLPPQKILDGGVTVSTELLRDKDGSRIDAHLPQRESTQ